MKQIYTTKIHIFIFILSIFLVPEFAYAIIYAPGETLNPACAPTDTECKVEAPVTATASTTFAANISFNNPLTLSSTSTPATTTNKLYNVGGVLYWSGSMLTTASSGIALLNGLSTSTQTFATSTNNAISINISSSGSTHTFSLALGSNYLIPLTASSTTWNSAYNWTQSATSSIRNAITGTSSISYSTTTGIIDFDFSRENIWSATNTFATTSTTRLSINALSGLLFGTNGVVGTTSLNALSTNELAWAGNTITSTVNGVATTTNISYASATTDGLLSTTTQTIAGAKIFTATTTLATTSIASLTLSSLNGLLFGTSGAVGTVSTSSLAINFSDMAGLLSLPSQATGTLAVTRGGTGTSTTPSIGQLLLGNASGGYDLVASSSLVITGSEGQTITFNAAGNQVATSTLFIASSTNVGIGTTTPGSKLTVAGSAHITGLFAVMGTSTLATTSVTGLSINTITGGGLTDCDTTTSKLQYDATTLQFSCDADDLPDTTTFIDDTLKASALYAANDEIYAASPRPNITPTRSDNTIMVAVTVRTQAEDNDDSSESYKVVRATGTNPSCTTDTTVGIFHGGFNTQDNFFAGGTGVFLDSPATTTGVRYTLCANEASSGARDVDILSINFVLIVLGADIAENYYTSDDTLAAGDIVAVDASLPAGAKKATASSTAVFGVVSTAPAHTLDDGIGMLAGRPVPIALTGRVPVKVTNEDGSIAVGDRIAVSRLRSGYGKKAVSGEATIGIALSTFEDEEGKVLVYVENEQGQQVLGGDITELDDILASLVETGVLATTNDAEGEAQSYLGKFLNRMIAWFADAANGIGKFFAKEIYTDKLCTTSDNGDTYCLTKNRIIDLGEKVLLEDEMGADAIQDTSSNDSINQTSATTIATDSENILPEDEVDADAIQDTSSNAPVDSVDQTSATTTVTDSESVVPVDSMQAISTEPDTSSPIVPLIVEQIEPVASDYIDSEIVNDTSDTSTTP